MFSKDFNIDFNILAKRNIPILINNKEWKKLFENVNDKKIEGYKDALNQLLQEQKQTDRELVRLKKEKKKIMLKILNLSDEANNSNNAYAIELLEQSQSNVIDINTKLEELTFRSETIPREIREVNFNLLKETIQHSYKELQENEEQFNAVNNEINEMREKLKSLIEQKHDFEERINTTYRFLHGLLGNEEMEKLDKMF